MSQHSTQTTVEIYRQGIPITLQHYPYWLVTQGKRPVCPSRWNDADRLMTFEGALDRLSSRRSADGIAYAFQQDGPFVGVDFDDVRDPETGQVESEVEELIFELNSYTEVSSSATGLHVLLTGERDQRYLTKGDIGTGHLEVYDSNRYFILTADRYQPPELPANPKPADKAFTSMESNYLESRNRGNAVDPEGSDVDNLIESLEMDAKWEEKDSSLPTPEQVRATACESDPQFADLWHGSAVDGITDDSKLDLKLVARLAYWCQQDPQLMDRCFRASRRYHCRDDQDQAKWDKVHTSGGRTYGELLISKGLNWNPESHGGQYITPE